MEGQEHRQQLDAITQICTEDEEQQSHNIFQSLEELDFDSAGSVQGDAFNLSGFLNLSQSLNETEDVTTSTQLCVDERGQKPQSNIKDATSSAQVCVDGGGRKSDDHPPDNIFQALGELDFNHVENVQENAFNLSTFLDIPHSPSASNNNDKTLKRTQHPTDLGEGAEEQPTCKKPCGKPCNWCGHYVELLPNKLFCDKCSRQGKECVMCHRPLPEHFYENWATKCIACFKKSQKGGSKKKKGKASLKHPAKNSTRVEVHSKPSTPLSTHNDGDVIVSSAISNNVQKVDFKPNSDDEKDPLQFVNTTYDDVHKEIERFLTDHTGVKWSLTLEVEMVRVTSEGDEIRTVAYFHSDNIIVGRKYPLEMSHFSNAVDKVISNMGEFQREGSGWALHRIIGLVLNMTSYKPLTGSTYIPTPAFIERKKAVVNVQNRDDKCFLWAVLAGLYPVKANPNRVQHYEGKETVLNTRGINFPVQVTAIGKFEHQNSISVNVFGFDDKQEGIFPIRMTEQHSNQHVNLLLISEGDKQHYLTIKSLSRLLRRKKNDRRHYYCPYCLHGFISEKQMIIHKKDCSKHPPQKLMFPEDDNKWLSFNNVKAMQPVPFVIYADLESFVMPIDTCKPNPSLSSTQLTHKHEPSGFCYMVVSHDAKRSKEAVVYRGPEAIKHLIDNLLLEVEDIQQQLQNPAPISMSDEEGNQFHTAISCYICGKNLDKDKVRDHCHLTGRYRGAAHNACNLKLQSRMGVGGNALQVPVIFHNLKGYDANHIMSSIHNYMEGRKLTCIANNMEKYITFSLGNLKFIDSLNFLNTSLDTLVKNLEQGDKTSNYFYHLHKHFPQEEHAVLLRRKGVYPYSHVSCSKVFEEDTLPPKCAFYNDLAEEAISDEDYQHAKQVWETFNMQNMGDYHDLYLKTDVLLLADVFENFRRLCLQTYKLDPAHYISAPSLSWDSMLLTTGVQLELLTDPNMYLFIEKGIRGGISTISHRYVEANNKYMEDIYDPEKETSYIAYWDANNLYGWSMCEPLPHKDFQWLTRDEIAALDLTNIKDDTGYILEVDMDYPESLHDQHNDYPLAPEKCQVSSHHISPYCKEVGVKTFGSVEHIPSTEKLITHLGSRTKYIIHHRNLQEYMRWGMKLKYIHRAIRFTQSAWLKPYIELNTEKRKTAKDEFEKDFFKLLNNSVFGKSCENMRNRRHIELVVNDKRLHKLTAKPSFKRCHIFSEFLVGVENIVCSLHMKKPIYVGFTTLELSKVLMYNFHYGVVKSKYGEAAQLLFTDTDSLCYHIRTPDLYGDMLNHQELFDTSNYSPQHFLYSKSNAKVLGKMKDELATTVGLSFVGLRAKMYSLLTVDNAEKKTAKGVMKAVIQKKLSFKLYKSVLEDGFSTLFDMRCIRASNHNIFTQTVRKVALSPYDDKRYILHDGISTLAHGHYKTGITFPDIH